MSAVPEAGAFAEARAVLFDLDGTLVDSLPGILEATNLTLAAEGLAPKTREELVPRIGPPLEETFSEHLGRPVDDVVRRVVADYRGRYASTMLDGSVPFPGIAALVEQLRRGGRPLAVATSKSEPLAVGLLEHLGLAASFEVVCGPRPPRRESKADCVARALATLGVPASSAVLVGDRSHDVHGGHAHGVRTIGVLWGYGTPAELREAGADALAADVPALGALLRP